MCTSRPVADSAHRADRSSSSMFMWVGVQVDRDVLGADVVGEQQRLVGRCSPRWSRTGCRSPDPASCRGPSLGGQLREHRTTLARPAVDSGAPYLPSALYRAPGQDGAAQLGVTRSESTSRLAPRSTTAGSALDTSASKEQPREQATASPASAQLSAGLRDVHVAGVVPGRTRGRSKPVSAVLATGAAHRVRGGVPRRRRGRARRWGWWSTNVPSRCCGAVISRNDHLRAAVCATRRPATHRPAASPDLVGEPQYLVEVVTDSNTAWPSARSREISASTGPVSCTPAPPSARP